MDVFKLTTVATEVIFILYIYIYNLFVFQNCCNLKHCYFSLFHSMIVRKLDQKLLSKFNIHFWVVSCILDYRFVKEHNLKTLELLNWFKTIASCVIRSCNINFGQKIVILLSSLFFCTLHFLNNFKYILQALDEEYLKVDAQFGGVDQRKIFTFAEKVKLFK